MVSLHAWTHDKRRNIKRIMVYLHTCTHDTGRNIKVSWFVCILGHTTKDGI